MNGEEGLHGSWFTGTIAHLQQGFALVTYDELMVSEDADTKLQEWYPLPQTTKDRRALLPSDCDAHFGPGFKLRPIPPTQVMALFVHSHSKSRSNLLTSCVRQLFIQPSSSTTILSESSFITHS